MGFCRRENFSVKKTHGLQTGFPPPWIYFGESEISSWSFEVFSGFLWYVGGLLGGGWTNPFQKYARQIGSFPQVGVTLW